MSHLLSSTPLRSAQPGRRVLSRDEMIALGEKLLSLVDPEQSQIAIEQTARAITKVANGSVLTMDDGDVVRIRFGSIFGSGLPVRILTNQLNDAALRKIVASAAAMTPREKKSVVDNTDVGDRTLKPRPLLPVKLWRDASAQGMDTARGDVIPQMVEQVRASGLNGAATVAFMARSTLYMWRQGLTSFCDETDCEVSVTARTPDGETSGWAGQAHRDWARIQPFKVVAEAIDMTNRSRNAVAFEPGRHTAILGPAAVAQLVAAMARSFDFMGTMINATPFAYLNHEKKGRHTKLGERVVDARLMIVSDPADPEGGFPPFYEDGGREYFTGFPTTAITYIDHGVLKQLSYGINDAASRNVPTAENPYSMRVTTVPGTKLATIDDMIANCKQGVYVHRFSDVHVLDGPSGQMTGVTRDGCFFIKDGKIEKPIVNFRFIDSPFFAFNKIEMIGESQRAAFGNTMSLAPSRWFGRGWPRLPIIVPPMMIQSFNFAALASAV